MFTLSLRYMNIWYSKYKVREDRNININWIDWKQVFPSIFIFLNEILSAQKYFGIALIVVTSLLISYRKSESGNSLSSAFKLMIPFSVVLSVYTILLKYLLSYLDYWSIFFWMIIGSFVGVLFLLTFSKSRKEFVETVPIIGRRTFIVAFVSEGLYVLGTICALIPCLWVTPL